MCGLAGVGGDNILCHGAKIFHDLFLAGSTAHGANLCAKIEHDAAACLSQSCQNLAGSCARRKAEMLVGDPLGRLEQLWVDSMTLKPLPEARGQVLPSADGTILQVELATPEVLVVRARLGQRP